MNRANLAVPDSKAAKTKIARNKNESGNSARVKNKAVAANKAVTNKEATSKADDKSCLSEHSNGGGRLPPFRLYVQRLAFSPNNITTSASVARDCFL
jgi:hypothetical protein